MYSSLVRHVKRFPGVYWTISNHPNVTLSCLRELPDYNWNWTTLTVHKNWNWEWVRTFPDKEWDWETLSDSRYFLWDWVREFPNKPWNWKTLSNRVNDISILKEFPDKDWDWYDLTLSPHVKIKDIYENPNFPWEINELLFTDIDQDILDFIRFYRSHYDKYAWADHSTRTPWTLIKNNLDLPWVYNCIRIRNSNEFEESDVHILYASNTWDWANLSSMIDFKIILKYVKDFPWNFFEVSRNKTVTYEDVVSHPELPWNYSNINLDHEIPEWIAANIIKRYWKKVTTDPSYDMCRKVVLKHFEDVEKSFPILQ